MIARMAEDEVRSSVASRCRTGRSATPAACGKIDRDVNEAIARHSAAGFLFDAGGVRSFARQTGEGADVVLLHGVPVSSFLYRKVLPVLADQGLRATAFDFPGLGLADRPEDFDYTWSRLAAWTGEAIDALGLDRIHLVVHDIGGPIGFEWAIRNPDRVLSLTVLNTLVDVGSFHRPVADAPVLDPRRRRGLAARESPLPVLGDLLLGRDREPGGGAALRHLRARRAPPPA